jgi:hypothetical protein
MILIIVGTILICIGHPILGGIVLLVVYAMCTEG